MTKEELEEEVTRLRNENLDIINKYTRFAETDRRTIAELKADNDARKFAMIMSEKVEKQLREKNAELEQQIEKMKNCGNCTKGNCVNIGQKGKACAYWTSNELGVKEKC